MISQNDFITVQITQFKRLNSNVACFIVTTACHCYEFNTNSIALFCTAMLKSFWQKADKKEPKKIPERNRTRQNGRNL